jgi:Mg/Co/Ni transporter MgtE
MSLSKYCDADSAQGTTQPGFTYPRDFGAPMTRPRAEELQTILAQGRLDRAVSILQRLDPTVAADTFMDLPYEQQQILFRRLPIQFAARLAPIFPYYHTFVLLHTLLNEQMVAVVEK